MKLAIIDTLGLCYDGSTLSKRGLGGSESAVILMSAELSKIGFEVTVFNDCTSDDAQPGVYNGVTYQPLSSINHNEDVFDVVIGSRSVATFAGPGNFKSFVPLPDFSKITDNAKWKVLWMHDTFCDGDILIEDLVLSGRINEIFTLSDWHTSYVATCDHGKKRMFEALKNHIYMTRNGIKKHIDWVDVRQKDPDQFIFNASVTKGMIPLVEKIWPMIKQRIPSAKLTVIGGYYRFRDGAEPDEQEKKFGELVAHADLDIYFTGIIRQDDIAYLLARSSFMIYPAAFPETFGISSLESLAYNTPIITCRFGALEETAIDIACYKMEYPIEPNGLFPWINTDAQCNAFVEMVCRAHADKYLHQQKMYACNQVQSVCEWSTVAKQWKQHFYKVLDEYLPVDEYREVSAINYKVRSVFGRRFTNPEEPSFPSMPERKIVVIIPAYNAEKYIGRCLDSVLAQDYSNYEIKCIDDASDDNTWSIMASKGDFTPIANYSRYGAVFNQLASIRGCEPDDIVILLDGDDTLVNDPNIFKKINELYSNGAEFTYGSCWSLADNIPLIAQEYPPEVKKNKSYRDYRFNWNMPYTHLRTFLARLIKIEPDTKFCDENGEWFKAGGDTSIFYTALENADPDKVVCVPEILVNYNDLNPLNDYKVNGTEQTKTANKVLGGTALKNILIAVPTARYIEPDTFKSIYDLIIPPGCSAQFQYFYGYNVDQVRNLIASWVVNGDYDYLFSVDHDITFAPDTLVKLLAHDKPIVSGIYRQRIEPEVLEIYDFGMQNVPYDLIKNYSIVNIGGCGFGCVLVKKQVMVDIGYPQFVYKSAIDHANTFSEDLDFCVKAVKAGHSVWCDPTILCGHHGKRVFEVGSPVAAPQENPVQKRLRELADQRLLPESHASYLQTLKTKYGFEPKVIYDIGSCVLHWTTRAKEVWPDAEFCLFEAMSEVEFLYKERGFKNYYLGVLSDRDGKLVEFYKNVEHPGGNSYYQENPELSPRATELFPESSKSLIPSMSLATIVYNLNLPVPDLIKMDVQGAEMDILEGAWDLIYTYDVPHIILELQHVDYNLGASKADEVIALMDKLGYRLEAKFSGGDLGVDADYHFMLKPTE